MFWKIFVPLTIMAFLFGFPVAEFIVHGLDASLWPNTIQAPSVWFTAMRNSWGLDSLLAYRDMAFGQTKALGPYGRTALAWILAGPLLALVACFVPNYGPRRDPRGTYGNARWASRDVFDDPPLSFPESGFPFLGEDLRDRGISGLLNELVGVVERSSEAISNEPPDGGLPAPHHPDQPDVSHQKSDNRRRCAASASTNAATLSPP